MICINNHLKQKLLCIICIAAVFLTACSSNDSFADAYAAYENPYSIQQTSNKKINFFSSDLCVTGTADLGVNEVAAYTAGASGAFNITRKEVVYASSIYEKMFPASLTKILTAYIILNNCKLDDKVTISENAVNLEADASNCGLKSGDVISVESLLYGLLLPSGNDAAIALAEYCCGSVEAFADKMNQTAKSLGATASHFCNPSGLHDDNHYTTVYDLYLIFQSCIKNEEFVKIINTKEITVKYSDIKGESVQKTYENTNRYLIGKESIPSGFEVIGGKTGTTNAAGNCLVLLSKNAENEEIVSIVMKSASKTDLYNLMSQILNTFCS